MKRTQKNVESLQKQLTDQTNRCRCIALENFALNGMEKGNPMRMAYLANDSCLIAIKVDNAFYDCHISDNRLFLTVVQMWLGKPLSALKDIIRRGIQIRGKDVDEYGFLIANTGLEGAWRTEHDKILQKIYRMMRSAQMDVSAEVRGIRRGVIPQEAWKGELAQSNIIPDLVLTIPPKRPGEVAKKLMLDLKLIHAGGGRYKMNHVVKVKGGQGYQPKWAAAVKQRELEVPSAYNEHAREIEDKLGLERDEAGIGPVRKELDKYEVKGICIGGYGEAGPNLQQLLRLIAEGMAERMWRAYDVDDVNVAKGICWAKVRRSVASAAALSQAKLIVDRIDALENRGSQSFGFAGELPHSDEPFHPQVDYHGPQRW